MPDLDEQIDLRDTKNRLRRLALAAAVGLFITTFVMQWIKSTSRPANSDPVGASTVPLLAIGMFIVITAVAAKLITKVATRRRS